MNGEAQMVNGERRTVKGEGRVGARSARARLHAIGRGSIGRLSLSGLCKVRTLVTVHGSPFTAHRSPT